MESNISKKKIVVDNSLYYEEPNTKSKILGVLRKDEIILSLEEINNWIKISYKGFIGYIRSNRVQ